MDRIGVDLGGTNIVVGRVDDSDRIVVSAHTPTLPDRGSAAVLADITRLAVQVAAGAAVSGVGIGCPGSCDSAAGVVRSAHNLGWERLDLRAALTQRLGLPVFLGNDADCAALGEVRAGAAKGRASALLITLGTGVGGGYVLDGRIVSGHAGRGGEFGHICIAMDGAACTCGQRGCWEAYASATALIAQAKAAGLDLSPLNGQTIYAAAAAGDPTARAVTAKYATYVGVGLVSLINALAPEVVLLGGGVSGAGEALLAPLRDFVADHAFVRDGAQLPAILPAALGGDAGVIGAAALVEAPS